MIKPQAITGTPKRLQLPLRKRLMLVTALLLSGGPLTVMASTQAAYASPASPHQPSSHSKPNKPKEKDVVNIVITCKPGTGGKGGKATEKSGGANGGGGGNCTVTIPIKVFVTEKNNLILTAKHKVKLVNNEVNASAVVQP